MSKRLSPVFIQLTQDALLRAFWHRPALRLFLQQHRIKESSLAQWHTEQTKRDYIFWLWPRLVRVDGGHDVILAMARSLSEMDHFPDLERREDTRSQIAEARRAVLRLRAEVQKINLVMQETAEAAKRRKAAREEMAARQAAQQSLEKLQAILIQLTAKQGTIEGGFAFERWFYDLAIYFEMDARPSYKADDRQIDGSITHEGTTFLIETKFTKEPIDLTHVDSFMAKIESKADNTMGILVSIAGFEKGAIKQASKQRTPMLLVDHGHIFNLVFPGLMTLPQIIARIKRHASQSGSAHLAASDFSR